MSAPTKLSRSRNAAKLPSSLATSSACRASTPAQVPTANLKASQRRCLATVDVKDRTLPEIWFTGSCPAHHPEQFFRNGGKPPDERTVKLGTTLRTLQERLPTLLQTPLPQEILSPQIKLHLFPSTHPHLPTVSGRVAYNAALWTSPIAWGRVPLVGNVRLQILSERMVKKERHNGEQLIVRWQTSGKTKGKGVGSNYEGVSGTVPVDKITAWLGGGKGEDDSKEFTGLFLFEFDEEGRVVSHTIEHVQEGGDWEKGVGARVVGLTDWLLGGMKGRGDGNGNPCPAYWKEGNV